VRTAEIAVYLKREERETAGARRARERKREREREREREEGLVAASWRALLRCACAADGA
jgi:hypothetical protein